MIKWHLWRKPGVGYRMLRHGLLLVEYMSINNQRANFQVNNFSSKFAFQQEVFEKISNGYLCVFRSGGCGAWWSMSSLGSAGGCMHTIWEPFLPWHSLFLLHEKKKKNNRENLIWATNGGRQERACTSVTDQQVYSQIIFIHVTFRVNLQSTICFCMKIRLDKWAFFSVKLWSRIQNYTSTLQFRNA